MVSIQVTEGRAAIEALAGEWESMVEDSFAELFSRPGWSLAWLDVYPQRTVAVVTARVRNRLIGVLPLARIRTDDRGLYMTRVSPLAPAITDFQPPILDPEFAPDALPLMLDAAIRHFGRHGVYWWPNIPSSDPSLGVLRAYFAAHDMPYQEERETAPRMRLEGNSYADLEKTWTSSHRKDVRRQRKRLAEQGPVSLWMPETLDQAEVLLREFFRVHDEKWLAQGYPGIFDAPARRKHFEAKMRRHWNRGLHFSTIRCGSTNVSYHFGFLSGGWLLWYRPTYRSEFHGYSPGKIHVATLIEEGYRLHWKGFDFLLGLEPYKLQWTSETLEVVSIHAGFHELAPAYFWFARGKPLARKHMQMTRMRIQAWLQRRKLGKSGEASVSGPPPPD